MISIFRYKVSRNLHNVQGWTTPRKIIVIESDDWGSIRMPSKEVYEHLLKKGIRVDKCPYNRFDTLASEEDLNLLFNLLLKYKDRTGNHPIITANCVVANPDFDKIKESGFHEYYYELIPETFRKYPKHQNSFTIWKEGMAENIFLPQFHGREHVNIKFWLKQLIEGNNAFCEAFKSELWGLGPNIVDGHRLNIQASFDTEDFHEINDQKLIIQDGLRIFNELFDYKSASFIANNFIWDSQLNATLLENGVSILQGMKKQYFPIYNSKNRKSVGHNMGENNESGQVYLMRNCFFEPSLIPEINPVSFCMNDIQNAFFWQKPAIITSHRLNFIGGIVASNRDNNLKSFDNLLEQIIKKWPDVEFMTSVQLGNLIAHEKNIKV